MKHQRKVKKLFALFLLVSLLLLFTDPSSGEQNRITEDEYLWTDKDVYEKGVNVVITVKNDGSATSTPIVIDLGIQIVDVDTDVIVFGPLEGVRFPMVPEYGRTEDVTWNQTDTEGRQVSGGRYRVEATQRGFEHTAEFTIEEEVREKSNAWFIPTLVAVIGIACVFIYMVIKRNRSV